METELLTYEGARIELHPYGAGWRAAIYMPGAKLSEAKVPRSRDPEQKATVVKEAKAIVDRWLNINDSG